jgi:hypothetical protein
MNDRIFSPHLLVGLGSSTPPSSALTPSSPPPEEKEACCSECAESGGSCGSKSTAFLPGQNSSFPVGFGQTPTTTIVQNAATAWAVPLTIGAIALVAGFGLAYVIAGNK